MFFLPVKLDPPPTLSRLTSQIGSIGVPQNKIYVNSPKIEIMIEKTRVLISTEIDLGKKFYFLYTYFVYIKSFGIKFVSENILEVQTRRFH